jgi:hypothetical protein
MYASPTKPAKWIRFRVPDAPEGRSVNVLLLSILYAVLATSFARSENILSTPACNARSDGFTASTFAVVRLEDIHEIAHLRFSNLGLPFT